MAEGSVLPSILDVATGGLGAVAKSAREATPEAPAAPALKPDQALSDPDTHLVAVTNPDGSTDFVRPEDAPAAIAQGSRAASEGEYYAAKSGALGTAASAGVGALQGATFEFADPLMMAGANAFGDAADVAHMQRTLRAARDMHPNAYMGGEIVGSLVPALLGGAPAEAGEIGESVLSRAFARASAVAPRAALEGGAFGVGHQLTEDALGDHATTAEKLLASADGGAVFGALLGGGFAAGGGAIGDVITKLRGGPGAATASATTGASSNAGLRGWLRDQAEEQAFRATGAGKGDIRRLGATGEVQGEGMRRLGRRMLDEGISGPTASKAEMAERVEQRLESVGTELADMRKPLDKSSVRPLMQNITARAEAEIVKPLTGRTIAELQAGMSPNAGGLFGDAEAKPALDALERFEARAGSSPTFERLHDLRLDLDQHLKKAYARIPGQPMPPGEESLRTLRTIVEDEYTRAGEEAAKQIGGSFEEKYQIAKGLYGDLKSLQGIFAKTQEGANRAISLTDTIAGAGGMATAAATVAAGHPLGALAMAVPVVNKAIRTYGNQLAATVFDKASQLQALQRVSSQINTSITKGATGFLKGGAKTTTAAAPKAAVTAATAQQLRGLVQNPTALRAHVEDVIAGSGLRDTAPKVSQALATTVMRAATYLASKAPSDPPRQGLALTPLPPRPVSAVDMQRFQSIVDTVNDPMVVVKDLEKGRIDRDKIEALRNVYPALYQKVRAELAQQAIDLKPVLTTQQEIALSVLTGEPINAQMRPENVRGFQASFDQGGPKQESGQGAPSAPRRPLKNASGTLHTGMDRIEGGDAT